MATVFDHYKAISISDLTHSGFLIPYQIKSGTFSWKIDNLKVGSIFISVNTYSYSPHLELSYKYNDKPIRYQVRLVSSPSNIGKGVVWYFICPYTGKQCRKLYAIGDTFLHREAYTGCLYATQIKSRKQRNWRKLRDMALGSPKDQRQIGSRYFKSHYAGKPTKWFLKRVDEIQSSMRMVSHLRNTFLD